MLRRVQKYIRDRELLSPGEHVLVCVSGGADSVALLDVLYRAGYQCSVAHCNFHLRGKESDRDEQFVRQIVAEIAARRKYGDKNIDLHIHHFDTTAYAASHHQSIEMAARELRYTWFAALAKELHCDAIAVAHHMNDQAETVVMNMRRCAGLRGLQGMRAKSERNGVRLIRPLLCTTRDYIQYYLKDIRQLNWVEDSSNTDTHYRRNRIRKEMESWEKAEIEHVAKTAEIIQGYVDKIENKDSILAQEIEKYEQK